eukprot:TRINITY_DN333_c0_g1_i2.p1 TRINITY_DN333_c0_g1~~TRINITY_DN333_c0_g1_i2.p1  ORF type:complete len:192 (+),score=30.29 TRINITY_DN333_c0_g1_i2:471-1046(+)
MIAVYGLRNSYRIVLKAERLVRRKIRRPAPIIEGYHSFPRFFIRKVFRAGLLIAMRWEGRAKNAAQLAADARLRASRTSQAVAHRIEDVRHRAEDVRHRAHLVRERAAEVRDRAKDQTRIMREKAAQLRKRAGHAKDRAVAARDKLLDMKDSVQQRVSSKITSRKYFSDARSILLPEEKPLPMVHTRISDT